MLPLLLAASTCFLAGLSWVVQVVVYPSFRTIGPTPQWSVFHAEHSRRIARVVMVPWAMQGVCVGLLLLRDGHRLLVWPSAALAAAAVVLTGVGAVPAHTRLRVFSAGTVDTLLLVSAVRTALWSAGAVLSLILVATA